MEPWKFDKVPVKLVALVFCFYKIYVVLGSTPLRYVEDKTIAANKDILDDRLYKRYVKTSTNCAVECQQNSACVMFGFTPDTSTCVLFSDEITNSSSFFWTTTNTTYYRAYCSDLPGYLYYPKINMCLRFNTAQLTFDQARDECWRETATLHEPRTQNLVDFYTKYATQRFWIGGFGDAITKKWFWFTGLDEITDKTGAELWGGGAPNSDFAMPCLELKTFSGVYRFNDRNCTFVRRFYCQI